MTTVGAPPIIHLTKSMEGLDFGPIASMSGHQLAQLLEDVIPGDASPATDENASHMPLASPSASAPPTTTTEAYRPALSADAAVHADETSPAPPPTSTARPAPLPHAREVVEQARLRLDAHCQAHGQDEGEPIVIKGRKIDVDVRLKTDTNELAVMQPMQLEARLVYESGLPVDELANSAAEEPLMSTLGPEKPWAVHGRGKFEVKIHVLSSMRNGQRFRLDIFPADPFIRAANPELRCSTGCVRTLSKAPRKKALGTDAASRAAQRAQRELERQRQLAEESGEGMPSGPAPVLPPPPPPSGASVEACGPSEKEELRRRIEEQDERIRQLIEHNKSVMAELNELRELRREAIAATPAADSVSAGSAATDGADLATATTTGVMSGSVSTIRRDQRALHADEAPSASVSAAEAADQDGLAGAVY